MGLRFWSVINQFKVLVSYQLIQNHEAGFYKPTIFKVHPPIAGNIGSTQNSNFQKEPLVTTAYLKLELIY